MTTLTAAKTEAVLSLQEAIETIWLEADLLDGKSYDAWLDMWTPDGIYVIPVDPNAEDFAAVLNIAYDDDTMRRMRVARLQGGRTISAAPAARTVRTVSRFRVIAADATSITVRAAQHLVEQKFERQRLYAADVTYTLVVSEDGLKLREKVVRLINCDESLTSISYLF